MSPLPAEGAEPVTESSKWHRKRARILDAAAIVLSRSGVGGTSVSAVAREARLNAPAIYYYFSSREALIEEVIVMGTHRLYEQLRAALAAMPEGASALDRIDRAIRVHLELLLAESGFAHAVIRNLTQLPESIRGRQEVEERKYNALWRSLFTEASSLGELSPDVDPRVAHLLLVGTLNWVTEWWNPKRGSTESLIGAAQAMFREGILAPQVAVTA